MSWFGERWSYRFGILDWFFFPGFRFLSIFVVKFGIFVFLLILLFVLLLDWGLTLTVFVQCGGSSFVTDGRVCFFLFFGLFLFSAVYFAFFTLVEIASDNSIVLNDLPLLLDVFLVAARFVFFDDAWTGDQVNDVLFVGDGFVAFRAGFSS